MMKEMNKVQQVKWREEDQMMEEMNEVQQVNISHKVVLAHRMNTEIYRTVYVVIEFYEEVNMI